MTETESVQYEWAYGEWDTEVWWLAPVNTPVGNFGIAGENRNNDVDKLIAYANALEACADACYSISGLKSGGWNLDRSRELARQAYEKVRALRDAVARG